MTKQDTHLLARLRIPDLHGLSPDPLTMCLPSGEYATECTQSECPVSVHSCSWTKHGGQHSARSSKR